MDVHTIGAVGGGMAMPVAWITSTGPVALVTGGQRRRCQAS